MKNAEKNRDPEKARKRAASDLRCAVRKLGYEQTVLVLREMALDDPNDDTPSVYDLSQLLYIGKTYPVHCCECAHFIGHTECQVTATSPTVCEACEGGAL